MRTRALVRTVIGLAGHWIAAVGCDGAGRPAPAQRGASRAEGVRSAEPYLSAPGGQVSVSVYGAPAQLSSGAAFWDGAGGADDACGLHRAANCLVRACRAAPPRVPQAGAIEVRGATVGRVGLAPDAAGFYRSAFARAAPFAPGDALTVRAAGGDVPAFETTLQLPPALDVYALAPEGQHVELDRARGLTARWVPGPGQVRVQLAQDRSPGRTALQAGVTVQCVFDRAAGAGIVPPVALADFAPSPAAAPDAILVVFASNSTTARAGRFDVRVSVNRGGVLQRAVVH